MTIIECLIFAGAILVGGLALALCLIIIKLSEIKELLHNLIDCFIDYNKSLDQMNRIVYKQMR